MMLRVPLKQMLFALLVAAAVPSVTAAQVRAPEADRDVQTRLQAVRGLLRQNPEMALKFLRKLAEDFPTDERVLQALGETYQMVGEIDSARVTFERFFRHHPQNARAGTSLGMLYIESGEQERGEAVFNQLLLNTNHDMSAYRMIGRELSNRGFVDMALDVYRRGQEANRGSYILFFDIAMLEQSMGDYDAAMAEYVAVIDQFPRQFRLAKDKVLDLLREDRADTDELLERLRARTGENDPHRKRYMEILAFAYLDQGLLEGALEMALEVDKGRGTDGLVLYSLAEQGVTEYGRLPATERAGHFDLCLRALEAYIIAYPTSPKTPRAKLMLIDLLVDAASGRVRGASIAAHRNLIPQAMAALDEIIASYPRTEHSENAYLKKGDITFRVLKQPEEALAVYRAGARVSRIFRTAFAERLGRVYLVMGRYDEAEKHFATLLRSRSQDMREAGVFYIGLKLGFTGKYESARDTLVALSEGNPSSTFTNDAIELAWTIEEGLQGDQRLLERYMGAIRFELADDTTAVVAALSQITSHPPDTPLRWRALFKLGEVYQGSGRYQEAIDAYERFILDYPADIQAPEIHRRIAQVYEYGIRDFDVALEKYEGILLKYPRYMFLDDIREDVKRLREKIKVNS